MSTYDFEPDPDDFGPEPAHIANNLGARRDSRIESGAVSLPTTPDQARKYANGMVPNSTVSTMLRSLAEQVEVLTAERDEWKARCEFSFEQRDDLSDRYQTASRLAALSLEALSKALKERDALKDAARLALDALEVVEPYINTTATACRGDKCREPWCASCNTEEEAEASAQEGYRAEVKALSTIAALKAAL